MPPASPLVLRCATLAELHRVLAGLEGQLTATLHLDPADEEGAAALLPPALQRANPWGVPRRVNGQWKNRA